MTVTAFVGSTDAPLPLAGPVRHGPVRRPLRLSRSRRRAPPPKSSETIDATIAEMTLKQKVGQLFVPYVTGGTADTVSAENRTRFGVDTPAQAVAKFHLGGVIYFAWSGNTDDPRSDRRPQQRSAAGQHRRRQPRAR